MRRFFVMAFSPLPAKPTDKEPLAPAEEGLAASPDVIHMEALLQLPPQQAAQKFVDQVKDLELVQPSVQALPIFRLARAFAGAPIGAKQEFVTHLVRGCAAMEAVQRADVARLALRLLTALTGDARRLERLARMRETEQRAQKAIDNSGALSPRKIEECQRSLKHIAASMQSELAARSARPLLTNSLEVLAAAEIWNPQKQPAPEECSELVVGGVRAMLEELGVVGLLQAFCDMVNALDKDERRGLIKEIAERTEMTDLRLLECIANPGGCADRIRGLVQPLITWRWLCCLVPLLELFAAFVLRPVRPIVIWLRADAVLWIIAVCAACVLIRIIDAVLVEKFVEAFSDASAGDALEDEADAKATPKPMTRMRKLQIAGAFTVSLLALALLAGSSAGLVAAVELLIGFFGYGSIASYVTCLFFDAFRLGTTATLVYVICLTLYEIHNEIHNGESARRLSQDSVKSSDYGSMAP